VVQFESLEQRICLAPTALFIVSLGQRICLAPTALFIVSLGQRPGSGSRYGFSAEGAIHSGAKRRAINGESAD